MKRIPLHNQTLKHSHNIADRWSAESEAVAKGAYVVRSAQLKQIAATLQTAGLDALLVKGSAVALSVEDAPWRRTMKDIDILVRPGELERVSLALRRDGYVACAVEHRPYTHDLLAERQLVPPEGALGGLVELHPCLDKVTPRSIDYSEIFHRAHLAPGLAPLLVPSLEDHILLVALHASMHDFQHKAAYDDLAALLGPIVDRDALHTRAKKWGLSIVMYLMLKSLASLEARGIDSAWVDTFHPTTTRRAAIRVFYDLSNAPPRPRSSKLGLLWVLRQSTLHDDLQNWVRGVVRYAGLRGMERIQMRLSPTTQLHQSQVITRGIP